jgi:Domain of unknown function (DUF4826)
MNGTYGISGNNHPPVAAPGLDKPEFSMDSDNTATIDKPEEAAWVADQRRVVVEYLARQRVEHGGVSLEPRWFFRPYLAVWAVRSTANPEYVGWWAVSGDVPTDYLTHATEQNAGDVLLAFSARWQQAAELMAVGCWPEDWVIGDGDPARAQELAPLLAARAGLLADFGMQIKNGEFAN